MRDVVRELVRLVGAESDELRGGMTGRPKGRLLESDPWEHAGNESDMVRFFRREASAGLLEAIGGRRLDR